VETDVQRSATEDDGALKKRLKTRAVPDRYFCQSTELVKATKPLSTWGRIRISIHDVWSGDVGLFEMMRLVVLRLFWRMVHKYVMPFDVKGTLKHTPVIKIGYRPGDMVEIKSPEEIKETLNSKGCNRGLRYGHGLNRFCGTRFRVRDRIDRMIIESTGQMIHLEGTVTLEHSTCLCYMNAFGGCPRQDLVYWREAWLRRVSPGDPD
jgi:hypothetical protein